MSRIILIVALLSNFFNSANFVSFAASTAVSQMVNPVPTPSFDISYNPKTKLLNLQTNLTYIAGENLLYTYVFSFKPWSEDSSLLEPENCTNRRWQDFNGNNPVLWSNLWSRQDLVDPTTLSSSLNSTAVNGDYLSWPTPSLQWSVVVASTSKTSGHGIGTITYNGQFTIPEILNCASDAITESMDDNFFIYRGTFYVALVQPAQQYPGYPDIYSTRSYTFPFVIRVPRNVDDVDTDVHNPTEIYFYISQLAWEKYEAVISGDYNYRFHLLLVTNTPASEYSSGAVVNYNLLSLVSNPLSNLGVAGGSSTTTASLPLSLDVTSSSATCAIDSTSMCVQKWSFYSQPVYNISYNYNDTYVFSSFLESCPAISSGNGVPCMQSVAGQYSPPLLSTILIPMDIVLDATININILDQFSSNITYYLNTSFNIVKESTNYLPGEDLVVFKHRAYLQTFSNNYYSLYMENVYACATVGGEAPFLGYDTRLLMQRYGCREEEYINGVLNIPAASIFVIALNESDANIDNVTFSFEYYKPTSMLKSEVGGKFSLTNLINEVSEFYLHVESSLFKSSRIGGGSEVGQSLHFATQNDGNGENGESRKVLYTFGKIEKLIIESKTIIVPNVDVFDNSSSSLSTSAIVGISLGAAAVLGLIVASFILSAKAGWLGAALAAKVTSKTAKNVTTINNGSSTKSSTPAPVTRNKMNDEWGATVEELKILQTENLPSLTTPSTVINNVKADKIKASNTVRAAKSFHDIKYIV